MGEIHNHTLGEENCYTCGQNRPQSEPPKECFVCVAIAGGEAVVIRATEFDKAPYQAFYLADYVINPDGKLAKARAVMRGQSVYINPHHGHKVDELLRRAPILCTTCQSEHAPYEPMHKFINPLNVETGEKVLIDRAHLSDLIDATKMLEWLLDGQWHITDCMGNPMDLSEADTDSKIWTSRFIAQLRNKVELATI